MAGVESLELQIKGNAKSAQKSIDTLIETLEKLKKATAGACGLGTVSDKMGEVADKMGKIKNINLGLSAANNKSAKSFSLLGSKALVGAFSLQRVTKAVSSWIKESNDYVENLNLFTAAMGDYASAAQEYAETVGEAMGIDPSAWMRNQGVFMTLGTGFGMATDRAAIMSQQMTQLGYDISSFFNVSVEDAMQKLQSGISGELEPLRRLGYDLSQAKLEAIAMSLGIDKAVSSMTQAEKAELRYYAIMTQVTTAHGDMARTIDAPANQLRILTAQLTQAARAAGNIFIPALNAILPYAIAALKVIRELANEIAKLFGYSMVEIDYSGLTAISSSASDASDALDDASKSAKKLKKTLLGIDELNVLGDNNSKLGDSTVGAGGSFDFDLPTYDFMGDVAKDVDKVYKTMKKILSPLGKIVKKLVEYKEVVLLGAGLIALGKVWGLLKTFWAWFTGLKIIGRFVDGFGLISVTGGNLFQSLRAGVQNFREALGGLAKVAIVAIAGFLEFTTVRDNIRDITLGCDDVAGKIVEIGLVAGAAATAMYVALGPGGLAVAALVAFVGAMVGVREATDQVLNKLVDETLFDGMGVPLEAYANKIKALTEAFSAQNDQIITWGDQIASNNKTIGDVNLKLETLTATLGITGVVTEEEIAQIKEQFNQLYQSVKSNMSLSEQVIMTSLVGALKRATPEISAQIDALIGEYQRYVRETQGRAAELELLINNGYDQLVGKHKDDPAYQEIMDKISGWYTELGYLNGSMTESGWQWQQTVTDFNSNKIDLGDDVDSAKAALAEISGVAKTALEDIATARDTVFREIDNSIAYAMKYGTDEDVQLLFDIRAAIEADYAEQEAGIKRELNSIFDAVQYEAISRVDDTKVKLEAEWDNLSIFEKAFSNWGNEEAYIKSGLDKYKKRVDDITSVVQDTMDELETNGSAWASDAMTGIIESLFKLEVRESGAGYNPFPKSYYGYKTTLTDAIESALTDVGVSVEPTAREVGEAIPESIEQAIETSSSVGDSLDKLMSTELSPKVAEDYGSTFGKSFGDSMAETLKKVKMPTLKGTITTSDDGTASIKFKAYASGGFPADGEMFIANEAGPELVGSIGNRTAVVNNDQIVESVSRGVAQAVSSVMGQSGTQVVEAKVNEKVLFEVVVDRNRRETMRTGASPLFGGV